MQALIGAAVLVWAAVLTTFDIRERRLPNALTLPGAAITLATTAACGRGVEAVQGAVALAGIYLLIHLLAPHAMGAGDVKLAIGVGGLTGALGSEVWVLAALGAPLLTAIAGTVRRTKSLPHGPSMFAASLAAAAMTQVGSGAAPMGVWDACCDG